MRLSHLRPVFESSGPFATAYLRTARDTATAAREVALRGKHAAEQLVAAGAPKEAGEAIERAVGEIVEGAPAHRVLVWADAGLLFDAALPDAALPSAALPDEGADEAAYWEPLPRLLAYVRAHSDIVPHVVAVVDRAGGDLFAVDALGQLCEVQSVEGDRFLLRKVKVGGWSHLSYLHTAEERWKANAKDVAAAVDRLVEEVAAERLVLAGDVRAREKLHDELGSRSAAMATDVEAGARGGSEAGADEATLGRAVDEAVGETARRSIEEHCAEFTQRKGKAGAAAEGLAAVTTAAAQGKLDTLLIGEQFDESAEAWIGGGGPQVALSRVDLAMLNADVATTAPIGSALLRAAVTTDAEAIAVPAAALRLRDGIGALLRY